MAKSALVGVFFLIAASGTSVVWAASDEGSREVSHPTKFAASSNPGTVQVSQSSDDELLAGEGDGNDDLLSGDEGGTGDALISGGDSDSGDLLLDDSAGAGGLLDEDPEGDLLDGGGETEVEAVEDGDGERGSEVEKVEWSPRMGTYEDPHAAVFQEDQYPSASECKTCHERIYWEWAASNHAYASISPMFHKFEQKITDLSQGTIGSFCVRCHQQVGTQRGEPRWLPLWERSKVSREGVTCITCHRVAKQYGKVNGERFVEPGDLSQPMKSDTDDSQFAEVAENPADYSVALDGKQRGREIHSGVISFEQMSKSEFCVSCHQVAVHPGIKLEIVWDQYRNSPALAEGVTCQDCHMGRTPGVADGYEQDFAAVVGGKPVGKKTDHHNHSFYGPGYSIAHPGVFPHNPDADRWTVEEWLKFDYRAGWGKRDFEEAAFIANDASTFLPDQLDAMEAAAVEGSEPQLKELLRQRERLAMAVDIRAGQLERPGELRHAYERFTAAVDDLEAAVGSGRFQVENVIAVRDAFAELETAFAYDFPDAWAFSVDREDAREVVEFNLDLLDEKRKLRRQVMENGTRIDGPFFDEPPRVGESFEFSYRVVNVDEGHNLPSGSLGAQPELWLNVALIDPDGNTVFESGYVDSNGDMADLHSHDVRAGRIEHDDQLFNLQTKFLTTNVKGTDREMYLPINFDLDQLPFIRPATVPTTVLNHPPFIRMENRSIPPGGSRMAEYTVPAEAISKPGRYRLAVRMRSRAEPIYFMKFVEATPEMERAMNEWMLDIHPYTVEFEVSD
jgi:hypothetical protein